MPYTCPDCGAVSHHPEDERQGYCGRCHKFERRLLVCSKMPEGFSLPGSTTDECSECGAQVDVAPSGRDLIAENGLTIVCLQCAMRDYEPDETEVMPVNDEQVAELIETLRSRRPRPPV